jgi:hypothetical protein
MLRSRYVGDSGYANDPPHWPYRSPWRHFCQIDLWAD